MTDRSRWERTKDLLDRVLDLAPAQRRAALKDATADDPTLFDEVWALVQAAEPDLDALEHPAALHLSGGGGLDDLDDLEDLEELSSLEGTVIGGYRLRTLLGQGGMGVVFEAERTGDVGGTVAVKLIKRGMDSALVARRFRQERQILARLVHPHIAHLVDGGVSESGRPYFVMEKVEGTPITTFCIHHQMGIDGRVRLFLQVLDAVAFAHRNLIVHRDLKPSNILVREDGAAKLLDFGVAKVLDEHREGDVTLTRLGGRVLTPSYSSPEQVRGEPVSTASDVYSLGVVLYELLAGRPPFQLDTAPMAEVQRVVSFEAPTRPSDALSRSPSLHVDTLPVARRALSGDLDAILLKALRKEPERRYESVMAFHDDLCRYLDRKPVAARRGTVAYRAERFLLRNRAAMAAGLAATIVLISGIVWGSRQAAETRRQAALAQQRVEDVQGLVNTLLFEVHDAVASLPGSTGARKLILDRAHEHLADVGGELPDDPDLLMDLAEAYRRLGEVEGRTMGASLGDRPAAQESFEQALALAERAVAGDSSDLVRLRALGLLHERLAGALVFGGEVEAGVAESRQAQAIYERIASAYPDSARHQLTAVIGRINLSDYEGHPAFPNLGRVDEAEAGYQEALDRLGSPPLRDDTSYGVVRFRGLVAERMARMLRVRGDFAASFERYRESLAVRAGLYEAYPNDDEAWRDVGVTHQNLCSVGNTLGRFDEAWAECDRALDIYSARFDIDSLNAQTLSDLASVHNSYEELHLSRGDTLRAIGHLALMAEWAERRLLRDPTSLAARNSRLEALLTRGLILARRDAPVPDLAETFRLAAELQNEGQLSESDAERVDELRRLVPS